MEPEETAVPRQRLSKHEVVSMRLRRIKYSICSERKVDDYFFPESPVFFIMMGLQYFDEINGGTQTTQG
jgi:hypothetical protein